MERTTVSKLYKYKPLKAHVGLEGSIPVKHKDVIVGVEIELEGINNPVPKISTNKLTEDGSLKLNGAEFVTIPIKLRYLEVELRRIFGGLKDPIVSARCSTHVHMNVRDMTPSEIVSLVLLYMIFERSLYRISGDRWNSNFCVPLNMIPNDVSGILKNWSNIEYWGWYKYTGLNLCPIWGGESSCIGTVEFRQLHGTTDVAEIIQWCNLITSLKRAAQDFDQEELLAHIRTMNTTSGYAWIAKEVFGRYAKLLTDQPTFVEDTESCISTLKFCIPTSRMTKTVSKPKIGMSEGNTLDVYLKSTAIKKAPTVAEVKAMNKAVYVPMPEDWITIDAEVPATVQSAFTKLYGYGN